MTTEFDRLKAIRDVYIENEQRRIEGNLTTNNVFQTLEDRARWYREGCDGLDDRAEYFSSGDCARDAASDLETALAEVRVLERVLFLQRKGQLALPITTERVKEAIGFLNRPQRQQVLERLGLSDPDA